MPRSNLSRAVCFALTLCCTSLPYAAHSGPNANAKVLIDLQEPQPGRATPPPGPQHTTCNPAGLRPCSEANTAGDLYPTSTYRHALLLITDADAQAGIVGIACGIRYGSGVEMLAWSSCGTLLLFPCVPPCWPESGTSTIITWDDASHCQRTEPAGPGTGVVAITGFFYLAAYSPDTLAVTPFHGYERVRVGACSNEEDAIAPQNVGTVVFSPGGVTAGYNPCASGTPVQPSTWGGIKHLFR